jgi:hypothetical protein
VSDREVERLAIELPIGGNMKKWLAVFALWPLALACGGDDTGANAGDAGVDATADATASDASPGDDGGVDNGEASTTYPAFMPPVPQVQLQSGGSVVPSPKIRLLYFSGETLDTQVNAAVAAWLASPIWTAQTTEYGVGAATSTAVTLTETPAAMLDDVGIQAWLATKLGGGDAGADAGADPAFGPTDNTTLQSTLFVLFYPSTTTITFSGQTQCNSFGSYHSDTMVAGKSVSYAVVPRCTAMATDLALNAMFNGLAFATDPRPTATPGYYGFDSAHLAWQVAFFGAEVPSACQVFPAAMIDGGSYLRSWSNAAMSAYHDPCIPHADATPYFASVPIMTDDLMVFGNATKGVKIPVGQSKTIDVELWSDGATSGPWTVSAKLQLGMAPDPQFTWDRTTGTNGEKLHLTITPTAAGAKTFIITSKLGTKTTFWAGVFGQ